jgi:transcriptional regulator with XRE-family HTH domain
MMDQDSIAAVDLALKVLDCSQRELALRLGVSPTQISKWKKGEYMSSEMEEKIRKLTGIGELQPSVVEWAGAVEAAERWDRLFRYLAEAANEGAETGYDTYPLDEDGNLDLLAWSTVNVLTKMGVAPPKGFPIELKRALSRLDDDVSDQEYEKAWETIRENHYTAVIYEIYQALTDIYGFYVAYIDELIRDDDLDLLGTDADNIEPCLMGLAATKIEVHETCATKFGEGSFEVRTDDERWLQLVNTAAVNAGAPLRAE